MKELLRLIHHEESFNSRDNDTPSGVLEYSAGIEVEDGVATSGGGGEF